MRPNKGWELQRRPFTCAHRDHMHAYEYACVCVCVCACVHACMRVKLSMITLAVMCVCVCVCEVEHDYTSSHMCVTLSAVAVKARTLLPHRHTLFTLTLCHLRDGSNSECRRAADAEMSSFSCSINWEWWPVSAFHFKINSRVQAHLRPTTTPVYVCSDAPSPTQGL